MFLSATGDLLALIVLALQVHELTGSGLAVSALVATTLVPMVALAPLAGLVADRFEGVRVLVIASLAQAAVAVALAFSGDLALILALASLLTAGQRVRPAGRVHPGRCRGRHTQPDRGDGRAGGGALRRLRGRSAAGGGARRARPSSCAARDRRELRGDRGPGHGDAGPPPATRAGCGGRAPARAGRLSPAGPRPRPARDARGGGGSAALHRGRAHGRDLLPQGRGGRERHRVRARGVRLDGGHGPRGHAAGPPRPTVDGGGCRARGARGAGRRHGNPGRGGDPAARVRRLSRGRRGPRGQERAAPRADRRARAGGCARPRVRGLQRRAEQRRARRRGRRRGTRDGDRAARRDRGGRARPDPRRAGRPGRVAAGVRPAPRGAPPPARARSERPSLPRPRPWRSASPNPSARRRPRRPPGRSSPAASPHPLRSR